MCQDCSTLRAVSTAKLYIYSRHLASRLRLNGRANWLSRRRRDKAGGKGAVTRLINAKGNGGIDTESEDLKRNLATLTRRVFEKRETCGRRKFARTASPTSGTLTSRQMNCGIDGRPLPSHIPRSAPKPPRCDSCHLARASVAAWRDFKTSGQADG